MPLPDTGRYTITNVRFQNLAVLPDANDGSDIVGEMDTNSASQKWNVTLLNNKKYTIKNHSFSNFAACETRAEVGANVNGRSRQQQWVIKEACTKGQFTISPTDRDVFWGLEDGESSTPITLQGVPNDTKSQWIFMRDL